MAALIVDSDRPNLKEVEKAFAEHEREYSSDYLRKKGAEDGQLGIPGVSASEASPFERELVHEASRLASIIVSTYRRSLEVIDARIKAEREFLEARLTNAKEAQNDLLAIEKEAAENSFSLRHSHEHLEAVEKQYQAWAEKLGRSPVVYIPSWLYIIFAVMIFLGEVPINALVFQIFGENQVMTWIMALIIGLSVPLSAHFVGIKLREHEGGFSISNAIKAALVSFILIAALYGLSLMRQTYLGEYKEQLGLTQTLVESSFMFFWLNLAVFCTAVVVAYLAHDPMPGFHEACSATEKAAKVVEKRERERIKQLKKARLVCAHALDQANAAYRDGKITIKTLEGLYDQILKEGQECESRAIDRLKRQISIYRHENIKHRSDNASPKVFASEPSFPLKLKELEEKLGNNGRASDG